MRVNTPTIVYARCQSAHIYFRVKTFVAGNREQIVAVDVQLYVLQPVVEVLERIA